jgi:hypothetical protein
MVPLNHLVVYYIDINFWRIVLLFIPTSDDALSAK